MRNTQRRCFRTNQALTEADNPSGNFKESVFSDGWTALLLQVIIGGIIGLGLGSQEERALQ